jgi:serine/threonine-protein kinase RsbW
MRGMPGSIRIAIPADTAHVALVRAAASALAARLDFTFDRITDLHIAVDEICSRLLAVSEAPTRIEVTFDVGDEGSLAIRATVDGGRRADRDLFTEWSRVILDAITDRYDASEPDGMTTFDVELSRAPS